MPVGSGVRGLEVSRLWPNDAPLKLLAAPGFELGGSHPVDSPDPEGGISGADVGSPQGHQRGIIIRPTSPKLDTPTPADASSGSPPTCCDCFVTGGSIGVIYVAAPHKLDFVADVDTAWLEVGRNYQPCNGAQMWHILL